MWRTRIAPVDLRRCASLLLLNLDGKLGDAVLQSALVGMARDAAPNCRITVVTTRGLAEYWRACDGADQVRVVPARNEAGSIRRLLALRRLARAMGPGSADVAVCFDPIPMVDYFFFLRWLRPGAAIGLSMPQYALFRISIPDPITEVPRRHAGLRVVRTLAALGIEAELARLAGLLPRSTRSILAAASGRSGPARIFINGYGASATRRFSAEQIAGLARALLARMPALRIVINADAAQRAAPELRGLLEERRADVELFDAAAGVCALFDAVAASLAVLTPDTGVVHVAAAAAIPVVVVYDDVDFNPVCWRPLSERVVSIVPAHPGPIAQVPVESLLGALRQVLPA